VIGVPLIVVGVVNVIALYRFQAWAPRGAFYITIVALAMYPLTDVLVISPWALLLTETSFLLWGAALAMAFFPPISERFRELPANSSMQPTGVKPPAAD